MGRGAVGERLEHVAEAAVHEVLRDLEDVLEDALLDGRVMDADRAAAEFDAVEHDVVVLAADLGGVGGEQGLVFDDRGGERVVGGEVALLFLVPEHQREFDDPEEVVLVGRQGQATAGLE